MSKSEWFPFWGTLPNCHISKLFAKLFIVLKKCTKPWCEAIKKNSNECRLTYTYSLTFVNIPYLKSKGYKLLILIFKSLDLEDVY